MIALSIITIVLTAVLGGEDAQRQTIAKALDDLQAQLAATSRLEVLQDVKHELKLGAHDIDLGLPGLRGRETVTQLADGLYEVRVEVTTQRGERRADLTTRFAREVTP